MSEQVENSQPFNTEFLDSIRALSEEMGMSTEQYIQNIMGELMIFANVVYLEEGTEFEAKLNTATGETLVLSVYREDVSSDTAPEEASEETDDGQA